MYLTVDYRSYGRDLYALASGKTRRRLYSKAVSLGKITDTSMLRRPTLELSVVCSHVLAGCYRILPPSSLDLQHLSSQLDGLSTPRWLMVPAFHTWARLYLCLAHDEVLLVCHLTPAVGSMDFYLLVIALALGSPQAGRCICSPARVPVTRTPTSGTSVGTSLRLLSSWLSVGFPCSWPLQMVLPIPHLYDSRWR